jgi:hypothetical protein
MAITAHAIDQTLLSIIRKTMPQVIANDLCGVQGMSDYKGWERVIGLRSSAVIYSVESTEIREWVESHPTHMWEFYGVDADASEANFSLAAFVASQLGQSYVFTTEMEVWFKLRWS